jgi:amidophosphoribosyltransferase
MIEDDKPHEECGVFGVWNAADAAALTALGLHALQHRGQEAAGIVSLADRGAFHSHKGRGLVGDNFSDARVIASLPGRATIGHNRYATTGETALRNVQPLYADFEFGGLAVAHNGNLTNAIALKRALVRRGCLFQSSTDSEVFVHLIAISLYANVVDRLIDALKQVQGAYSLVALHDGALLGARDPLGVRPLVLGRLNEGWVISSETCGLDIVGASFVRDIEPGEIVVVDANGPRSVKPFAPVPSRFCVFEHIYFARPDSVVEGTGVYATRKRIGAELAREAHVPADVIVPVPDSGVPAAMGYAAEAGIPMAYYEIMVRLSEAPERRLRMSDLAEFSNQSRSRLSQSRSSPTSMPSSSAWARSREAQHTRCFDHSLRALLRVPVWRVSQEAVSPCALA